MLLSGIRKTTRDLVQRIDVRGPAADWLGGAVTALETDGAVVLTGTGLGEAARATAATMLGELPALMPHEPELTVYARGHLRQYPPVAPDSNPS